MSIQKKVSVKNAVQQAFDNIGIETNELFPLFKLWSVEAERRIGSFTQYERKIYVLDIVGCRAYLPCEAQAVLGVLLGDYGCDCGLKFINVYTFQSVNARATPSFGFLVIDGGQVTYNTNITWRVHDNQIVFNNNYQTGKITVELLVYPIDNDGWIKINENHVYPIASFCEWMYMKRSRHKPGGRNYSLSEVREQFNEWSRLAAHAHAEDGAPGPGQIAQIAAAVNDPMSGMGNAFWLYQDPYYGLRSIV